MLLFPCGESYHCCTSGSSAQGQLTAVVDSVPALFTVTRKQFAPSVARRITPLLWVVMATSPPATCSFALGALVPMPTFALAPNTTALLTVTVAFDPMTVAFVMPAAPFSVAPTEGI